MDKLPSGQVRYPSNSWGAFAPDPSLDVGIVGEALAQVVRQTWFDAGGTEVTFEETFPLLAEYAKAHSCPDKGVNFSSGQTTAPAHALHGAQQQCAVPAAFRRF